MATIMCQSLDGLHNYSSSWKLGDLHDSQIIFGNQGALHIAWNSVSHQQTNRIEIGCHFARENVLSREIMTSSGDQLVNMLTKSSRGSRVDQIRNKLESYDICATGEF